MTTQTNPPTPFSENDRREIAAAMTRAQAAWALDDLVDDCKADEAEALNHQGMDVQLDYLATRGVTKAEILESIAQWEDTADEDAATEGA